MLTLYSAVAQDLTTQDADYDKYQNSSSNVHTHCTYLVIMLLLTTINEKYTKHAAKSQAQY